MARIKLVYIGGGSTRAPGTMASFIHQGENFAGSEVVLVDLDAGRLRIVQTLAEKVARNRGLDLTIRTSTDPAEALPGADAVLTSFRPGGFEARHLDESMPLRHGVIGQETQGPGGFFMALRSIHVMQGIVCDMERLCPDALLLNYTNPINIVSQAVSLHSGLRCVSLCEGPIIFPRMLARAGGLDPNRVDAVMIGLNHGCWSVRHEYDGQDMIPLLGQALEQKRAEGTPDGHDLRMLELAVTMESLPADYFQYYYFSGEILEEQRSRATTRAQDIMAKVPDYWRHYAEQAAAGEPALDPARSRGGIHELELAIDVLDAYVNDRDEMWPVNVANRGAIADLPDDLIVEVPGRVSASGVEPVPCGALPRRTAGLVKMLGEYQWLTARAGWEGTRREGIQALMANPLVQSTRKATAIYDEMSGALREFLPERLLR